MNYLKNWMSLQIDLGNFHSREAVYGFALKMALRAVILAFLFNIAALPVFYFLGLLPMPLAAAVKLSVASSWLIGGAVSGALALVTGNVIRELSLSRTRYERLSRTDMLSGLLNRRAFSEQLDATVGDASLVIFDLDRFKTINDCHGHCAGDVVIKTVGATLRDVFPDPHVTARLGGEEFGVIIKGGEQGERLALVERLRALIESRPLAYEEIVISTTVSGGVAEFQGDRRKEAIYSAADRALYLAKAGGRNRIVHESDGIDMLFPSTEPASAGGGLAETEGRFGRSGEPAARNGL